jgi:hypothetical protein
MIVQRCDPVHMTSATQEVSRGFDTNALLACKAGKPMQQLEPANKALTHNNTHASCACQEKTGAAIQAS